MPQYKPFRPHRGVLRISRRKVFVQRKVKEWKKNLMMMYKFVDGPVLYSLYAFGVEDNSVGRKFKTRPLTLFQMLRGEYPIGMGFTFIKSSNTLYMIGGQFRQNGILYSSKKVFSLDLTPLLASSSSSSNSVMLSIKEAPKMNAGKSNPIVIAASGKIYVLSSSIDRKYDPNTDHLGPVGSIQDYADMTPITLIEEDMRPIHIFEVFDPQSGQWTILPNPPNYYLWRFPTFIIGHVFIHHKIILNSKDSAMFSFDIIKKEWDFWYFPCNVKEPRDYNSRLMHLFYKLGFPGRGSVVRDTLITFDGRCENLHAYSIPDCKEATTFPHGDVKNSGISFNCMHESTGGLHVGAELVHFGRGIFFIIARDDDDDFFFTYGSKSIKERPRRYVTATIAEVVRHKLSSGDIKWRARTMNKFVLQDIDAKFGTFIYCFPLDGKISVCGQRQRLSGSQLGGKLL